MPGEDHWEILRDVHREASRLSRLVQDMLTLARGDAGAGVLNMEVPMHDLVHSVWRDFVRHHPNHQFQLGAVPEVTVTGDPDRLRQLLIILLDNATKYTPAGGTITLTTELHPDHWTVQVNDTGIGIHAADQERVFERFYRVDPARSRAIDVGGSGLGLSIAQWIVGIHQGHIELQSSPGVGTTVTFTLPLNP